MSSGHKGIESMDKILDVEVIEDKEPTVEKPTARELQLQKEKEELIAKNEEERRKLFKEIEELRKNK